MTSSRDHSPSTCRGDAPVGAASAADYEAVLADQRSLVRELDVLLNGAGAAEQASLCDIVSQVRGDRWALVPREATDAMMDAAWAVTVAVTPEERMLLTLGDNRQAFRLKAARRYRAMVDAALQNAPRPEVASEVRASGQAPGGHNV